MGASGFTCAGTTFSPTEIENAIIRYDDSVYAPYDSCDADAPRQDSSISQRPWSDEVDRSMSDDSSRPIGRPPGGRQLPRVQLPPLRVRLPYNSAPTVEAWFDMCFDWTWIDLDGLCI